MVAYVVPGVEGPRGRAPRRLNWVWYINIPEQDLPSWLVGTQEHRAPRLSIPRGGLRYECGRGG